MLNVCLGLNLSHTGTAKVILSRAVNPKWKIIPYTVTLQLSVKLGITLSTLSVQCLFHDSGNALLRSLKE